jgi:GNAT superfamily N-acetyltransferase
VNDESSPGPAELEAFQAIRWTDGGEIDRPAPPVERLRSDMARAGSVFLLAWLEWEPVGTGVSHSLKGAAEIAGVVTHKDRRRRGIAAAITSELVRRHFANGGDFAFLDAANDEAARVYERLGFSRFGAPALSGTATHADGQAGSLFVLFAVAVTAAEMALALAIIIALYRQRKSLDLLELDSLRG